MRLNDYWRQITPDTTCNPRIHDHHRYRTSTNQRLNLGQTYTILQSTFLQKHKVSNNDINANFTVPYIICSFLHYLDLKMLVNVKLDVSW